MELNRRDIFKGLAVALAAASIPITVEALVSIPDNKILTYLKRVRADLINQITYPPCILHEDGRMEQMHVEVQHEALRHVTKLIKELA